MSVDRSWRWVRAHRRTLLLGLVVAFLGLRVLTDSAWLVDTFRVLLAVLLVGVFFVPWCVLVVRSYRAGLEGRVPDPPA